MSDQALPANIVFTVGHSNHTAEHFCQLLKQHEIDVLVDVRTSPYSQYSPQFNRETLQQSVLDARRQYLFMGNELGGRPPEADCYDDQGHVLYSTLSQIPRFLKGIERVEAGIRKYRVALMCSEEDPTICHRFLLVARVLADRGVSPMHIRGDGRIETHDVLTHADEPAQLLLFPDAREELPWKSLRSVLHKRQPPTSSENSGDMASDDWSTFD